jgi:hypothetical protein
LLTALSLWCQRVRVSAGFLRIGYTKTAADFFPLFAALVEHQALVALNAPLAVHKRLPKSLWRWLINSIARRKCV